MTILVSLEIERVIAGPELLDDRDPGGMSQGLEEIGFELADQILHQTIIRVFAISNIPNLDLSPLPLLVVCVRNSAISGAGGRDRIPMPVPKPASS